MCAWTVLHNSFITHRNDLIGRNYVKLMDWNLQCLHKSFLLLFMALWVRNLFHLWIFRIMFFLRFYELMRADNWWPTGPITTQSAILMSAVDARVHFIDFTYIYIICKNSLPKWNWIPNGKSQINIVILVIMLINLWHSSRIRSNGKMKIHSDFIAHFINILATTDTFFFSSSFFFFIDILRLADANGVALFTEQRMEQKNSVMKFRCCFDE